MRILITGSEGQLASSLLGKLQGDVMGLPHRNLDIADRSEVERVIRDYKPSFVVNTAAFHNVVECEEKPFQALRVNALAVRDLASICRQEESRLITVSTDYVFGGDVNRKTPYTEADVASPVSIYGTTKYLGERLALEADPSSIVLRTCGLYGLGGSKSKGGNFVDKRIADAAKVRSMQMSGEQVLTPTSTEDLAEVITQIIQRGTDLSGGVYHATNEGQCSWADFTKEIYKISGLDVEVIPVDRGGVDRGVRKPLFSVLENARLKEKGINMPHWQDALRRYILSRAA